MALCPQGDERHRILLRGRHYRSYHHAVPETSTACIADHLATPLENIDGANLQQRMDEPGAIHSRGSVVQRHDPVILVKANRPDRALYAYRIEILVHPESIVHSLVAFRDGSVIAQLGQPDMRIPIAYTLGWPERIAVPTPRLDLAAIGRLSFEAPDHERFPALRLAAAALRQGGTAPTVLNAANEVAVGAFLAGRLGFLDIAALVEAVLAACAGGVAASLDEILQVDAEARRRAGELVRGWSPVRYGNA